MTNEQLHALKTALLDAGIEDTDKLTPRAVRIIHKTFRAYDESDLYPICGRFNATKRAIDHLREFRNGYADCVMSYYLALDNEISAIVNAPDSLPGMSMTYIRW